MTIYQGYTNQSTAGTLLRGLSLATLVAALSVALPAHAADKSATHAPTASAHAAAPNTEMPAAQKKQFEAFRKARSEMMQARKRLDKIQQAALKAHPELLKQQKTFGGLLTKTMKKNGYDTKKEIAKLKSLRAKLQGKTTPKDKKRKLAQQFQAGINKLNMARNKAMQDKKVKKARHSLQTAVISAMRKQDPDTDKLIAMVQSKQKELLKIRQSLLSQMQQSRNKNHAMAHSSAKSK